jgi:hypothetical protein
MDWGVMPPGKMWVGGSWSEREQKSTREQIEVAQYASDLQRGSNLIYFGILCSIACVVLHLATSSQHAIAGKLAKVFEWGIVGGVCMIIAGAILKKAIEYETGIAIAGILGAGIVLSRESVRGWSVSHVFKWLKVWPSESEPRIPESVSIDDVEFVCDTHSTDQRTDKNQPK